MEETPVAPKVHRGWPKGKPRKIVPAEPIEAPIHVRIRFRHYEQEVEFGCARRTVENGFHVFFYPSKRDPYRETRREFAIGEIAEIEITEARTVYQSVPSPVQVSPTLIGIPQNSGAPVIHSARKAAMTALETASGSIKMDALPNMTFGDSAG